MPHGLKSVFRPSKNAPPVWLFGLCGTLSLIVCAGLRALVGAGFPALPSFAVLTIGCFYWLAERRIARRNASPLHPCDIAAGRLGLLVHLVVPMAGAPLWLMASQPLKAPLIAESVVHGEVAAWAFAELLVFPLGIVGAIIAYRAGRKDSKRLLRLLFVLGGVSTLLLGILSCSGLARSRGKVDPDRYLASLTKVGRVSGTDTLPVSVDGFRFSVNCDEPSCAPQVEGPGIPRTTAHRSLYFPLRSDDPVVVFDDARSGVVILRSEGANRGWAFRKKTGTLSESLGFDGLSESVSPPRTWTAFGVLVALVSGVLILLACRHARAKGLVGGVADGAGRLVLSDGEVCTLSPGLSSHEGPVAARLGPPSSKGGGPYRQAMPVRKFVAGWAGTVEKARERLQDESSARLALVFVINCFALVPLVVASQVGLLP